MLDPWSKGKYLVDDFTCRDTLVSWPLNQPSSAAGSAAVKEKVNKQMKCTELAESGNYIFTSIAVETLGAWGLYAHAICAEIISYT